MKIDVVFEMTKENKGVLPEKIFVIKSEKGNYYYSKDKLPYSIFNYAEDTIKNVLIPYINMPSKKGNKYTFFSVGKDKFKVKYEIFGNLPNALQKEITNFVE